MRHVTISLPSRRREVVGMGLILERRWLLVGNRVVLRNFAKVLRLSTCL